MVAEPGADDKDPTLEKHQDLDLNPWFLECRFRIRYFSRGSGILNRANESPTLTHAL